MKKTEPKFFNTHQVLVLRVLIVVFVLLILFLYLFIKYYWQPRQYKQEVFDEIRADPASADLSDEQIMNYAECIYNELHKQYGSINNFPDKNNIVDIHFYKAVVKCTACSFYDKSKQSEVLKDLDSLAIELYLINHNRMPHQRKN